MTDGFEEAKEQRNWLERLGARIPGYRGFQDRELRRDVDKLQREHLAKELERAKGVARAKARAYADSAKIGALARSTGPNPSSIVGRNRFGLLATAPPGRSAG